jgi:thiosulfate/3-mercaptopyruvate sulfurtransferase
MLKSRLFLIVLLLIGFSANAWALDFAAIDTGEAAKLLNRDDALFVDARDPNAFNGWKLNNEKRGGHIPEATNLAASWVTRKLERTAEVTASKHLGKAGLVVVYGYDRAEADTVAQWLVSQGVKADNIRIYADGFNAWAASELPLSRLRHYETIVPAQWVKQEQDAGRLKVLEASWGEGKKYKEAHIPGATHMNTDDLESEARHWNFLPAETIAENLLKQGITADTPVAVYGEAGIDAARAAVAMLYVGVKKVYFINGGLDAWKAAGYPVASGEEQPTPAAAFGVTVPQHPELVIDMTRAKLILKDDNAELVSIRAWDEYIGKTSGYSYIKPKGRIKGAVWGHCGSSSYNVDDFRNPDNTMRDYQEIERIWAEWGITHDKEVAFYCGTGWRASETLLYARAMGFERASLYDDGWFIWSMDPNNPVATGDPK